MNKRLPWNYHDDLKQEYIIEVGKRISAAYHESLEYILEEKGDSRWSHGVRRYEWTRKKIRDDIESGALPFLSVLDDNGQKFELIMGQVPFKFKRTNVDKPADTILKQSKTEAMQLSLLEFAGLQDPCKLRWRLVFEDDFEGDVIRIAFVGLNQSGFAECFWEVPKDDIIPHITLVNDVHDAGVALPPAVVGLKKDRSNQKAS